MQELKLKLILIPALFCLIIPLVVSPAASWVELSPLGSGMLEFLVGFLIVLLCLIIPAGFLVCCVLVFFPRLNVISLGYMACAASFFIGLILSTFINGAIQTQALAKLADRSKPLVIAIEKYEQKYGRLPDSLNALVPEFIPEVPHTGLGATPEYNYESAAKGESLYGGNKWDLQVYGAGAGPLSFDTFIYLPLQNYSTLGRRGRADIRNIRDWAYWHRG